MSYIHHAHLPRYVSLYDQRVDSIILLVLEETLSEWTAAALRERILTDVKESVEKHPGEESNNIFHPSGYKSLYR